MQVDGLEIQVEAAVSEKLCTGIHAVGKEVSQLVQLLGKEKAKIGPVEQQEDVMVVVMRAQAYRELEGELLRREKELLVGAKPTPVLDGTGKSIEDMSELQ